MKYGYISKYKVGLFWLDDFHHQNS